MRCGAFYCRVWSHTSPVKSQCRHVPPSLPEHCCCIHVHCSRDSTIQSGNHQFPFNVLNHVTLAPDKPAILIWEPRESTYKAYTRTDFLRWSNVQFELDLGLGGSNATYCCPRGGWFTIEWTAWRNPIWCSHSTSLERDKCFNGRSTGVRCLHRVEFLRLSWFWGTIKAGRRPCATLFRRAGGGRKIIIMKCTRVIQKVCVPTKKEMLDFS